MHGELFTLNVILRTALIGITVLLGGLVTLSIGYCLLLLAVAAGRRSRRAAVSPPATRFAILIPAHDEELVIEATLRQLARLNYPKDLASVVLVADNCKDATVSIARSIADVAIIERRDIDNPGKPAALNYALGLPGTALAACDAVVIMDADTQMAPDFLTAMDVAFQASGARPFAAQGRYDVLNPDEGWRTALMAGALSLVHVIRPLAREALGLSVGLKGNGMCFSRELLRDVPWNPRSLTEDLEMGIDLIERKGVRVQFVADAIVRAQMPTGASAAAGQRRRWEGGRGKIVRERAIPLLMRGMLRFDVVAVDTALDLLLPPLANLGAMLALWGVLIGAGIAAHVLPVAVAFWWAAAMAGLIVYIVGGFAVAGAPKQAYAALAQSPFYMIWKLAAVLTRRRATKAAGHAPDEWVRTERAAIAPATADAPVLGAAGGHAGGNGPGATE